MEIQTLRARCRAPTQIGHDTSLWGSSQVSTSWMSSLEIITTLKRPTLLNNSREESELDREETTLPLSYTSSAHEVGTWWCWSCWSCQLRTQFRGRDCDVTQIKVRQYLTDFFSYLTFILWLWPSNKVGSEGSKIIFDFFIFQTFQKSYSSYFIASCVNFPFQHWVSFSFIYYFLYDESKREKNPKFLLLISSLCWPRWLVLCPVFNLMQVSHSPPIRSRSPAGRNQSPTSFSPWRPIRASTAVRDLT